MSKQKKSRDNASAAKIAERAGMNAGGGGNAALSTLFEQFAQNVGGSSHQPPELMTDSELGLLVRKLSKKDPTTRLKACQELEARLADKDESDLENILPVFANLYARRALLEPEWKVRFGLQSILGVLCTRLGRKIAPSLATFLGTWLCSCYDSHDEVSRAAGEVLEKTFSTREKQLAAVKKFKTSIITRVQKLLASTPAQLTEDLCGEQTGENDQEERDRYDRAISSALMTTGSVLSAEIDFWVSVTPWKFMASNYRPGVRHAAVRCMDSLFNHLLDSPGLDSNFPDVPKNLVFSVTGILNDKSIFVADAAPSMLVGLSRWLARRDPPLKIDPSWYKHYRHRLLTALEEGGFSPSGNLYRALPTLLKYSFCSEITVESCLTSISKGCEKGTQPRPSSALMWEAYARLLSTLEVNDTNLGFFLEPLLHSLKVSASSPQTLGSLWAKHLNTPQLETLVHHMQAYDFQGSLGIRLFGLLRGLQDSEPLRDTICTGLVIPCLHMDPSVALDTIVFAPALLKSVIVEKLLCADEGCSVALECLVKALSKVDEADKSNIWVSVSQRLTGAQLFSVHTSLQWDAKIRAQQTLRGSVPVEALATDFVVSSTQWSRLVQALGAAAPLELVCGLAGDHSRECLADFEALRSDLLLAEVERSDREEALRRIALLLDAGVSKTVTDDIKKRLLASAARNHPATPDDHPNALMNDPRDWARLARLLGISVAKDMEPLLLACRESAQEGTAEFGNLRRICLCCEELMALSDDQGDTLCSVEAWLAVVLARCYQESGTAPLIPNECVEQVGLETLTIRVIAEMGLNAHSSWAAVLAELAPRFDQVPRQVLKECHGAQIEVLCEVLGRTFLSCEQLDGLDDRFTYLYTSADRTVLQLDAVRALRALNLPLPAACDSESPTKSFDCWVADGGDLGAVCAMFHGRVIPETELLDLCTPLDSHVAKMYADCRYFDRLEERCLDYISEFKNFSPAYRRFELPRVARFLSQQGSFGLWVPHALTIPELRASAETRLGGLSLLLKSDVTADLKAVLENVEMHPKATLLAWDAILRLGGAAVKTVLRTHPSNGGLISESREEAAAAGASAADIDGDEYHESAEEQEEDSEDPFDRPECISVEPLLHHLFSLTPSPELVKEVSAGDLDAAVARLNMDTGLLAFKVLCYMCMHAPDSVNTWHSSPSLSRKQKLEVERAVATWALPVVLHLQVQQVAELCSEKLPESADPDQLVELRAAYSRSARHMTVTFIREELTAVLTTQFPEAWPLRPVSVDCPSIPGALKSRAQYMRLSVQGALTSGNMRDAVSLWAKNLSLSFRGVEDCTICYSIVHGESGRLPNKQCPTCKNKFHSECIFRWFRTSHKTTCPLCQNPF